MFTRQKIILGLMKNAQKPMPKTQVVKLAFLFAQEKELPQLKSFYRFVPYKYGPFFFSSIPRFGKDDRHRLFSINLNRGCFDFR